MKAGPKKKRACAPYEKETRMPAAKRDNKEEGKNMSDTSQNRKRILWVVQAAMLLALVVLAQLLTKAVPKIPVGIFNLNQLVTGTLVNLVLVVGAAVAGYSATAVAAVLSPVLAFLMGQMPPVPPMILVVAAGNLVIAGFAWAAFHARSQLTDGAAHAAVLGGIFAGAVTKCAVLWALTVEVVIPLMKVKAPVAAALTSAFSLPQGVTALAGGLLALAVVPALRPFQRNA